MKLGSVLGPFPGRLWLDLATHTLTVSPGTTGTAAEITFQITPDAAAGMIDGMLPSRPAMVTCPCGTIVKITPKGRIPSACPPCRRREREGRSQVAVFGKKRGA